jgi:hypothetical protein
MLEKTKSWGAAQLTLFAKYNYSDQLKGSERGKACSTKVGDEEYIQGFGEKVIRKEISRKVWT